MRRKIMRSKALPMVLAVFIIQRWPKQCPLKMVRALDRGSFLLLDDYRGFHL